MIEAGRYILEEVLAEVVEPDNRGLGIIYETEGEESGEEKRKIGLNAT